MNIPERLRYARSRAGLSGRQVQERTGIGVSSVSDFETGKREPSVAQLQKLASVYRRSVSFFLAEGPIPEELVLWREKPQAEAADVEAHFLRLCEQYHNLEVWTREEVPACLPPARGEASSYDYRDTEILAKQVRNQLELGDRPGLSLLSVLEEVCGVKIFHLQFEPSGTAASAHSETFGAAVLLNASNVRWRRNFDLAHELFHLLTWDIFRGPAANGTTSSCAGEKEEKLAGCFASNLLMPSDATRAAVNSMTEDDSLAFEDLFDIARQFDVSAEAFVWRMYNLRILSGDVEDTRGIAVRTREMAALMEERKDTEPGVFPERYKSLAVKALRHGAIAIGRFAEYLGITRQEAMRYVEQEVAENEEVPLAPA